MTTHHPKKTPTPAFQPSAQPQIPKQSLLRLRIDSSISSVA